MVEKGIYLTDLALPQGTHRITVKAKAKVGAKELESCPSTHVEYEETRENIPGTEGLAYEIITREGTSSIFNQQYAVCTGIGTATETDIVIGNTYKGLPVLKIANEAFNEANITSVTISNGIKYIGDYAFYNCRSLTSIIIPGSVTSIGYSAFRSCFNLTMADIGAGVTSIGKWAFSGCDSLTNMAIPEGVISIGDCAFLGCDSLTSVVIPESVTSIGNSVFDDCISLSNVTFNKGGLTHIPDSAFYNCTSLESIVLPYGIESIGAFAFCNCTSLKSLKFTGIKRVGKDAFTNCNNALFTVDEAASIRYLYRNENNPYSVLLEVIDKTKESYNIQSITLAIADGAFEGCSNMTSITIPDGVRAIGKDAFKNCTNVASITYIGSSFWWKSVELGEHFDYGVPVMNVYCESDGEYVSLRNESVYISGTIKFNETMERFYVGEGVLAISLEYTHEYKDIWGESTRKCAKIQFTEWQMRFPGDYGWVTTSIIAYKFDDDEWTKNRYRTIKVDEPQAVNIKFYEWLERNATFLDEEE